MACCMRVMPFRSEGITLMLLTAGPCMHEMHISCNKDYALK